MREKITFQDCEVSNFANYGELSTFDSQVQTLLRTFNRAIVYYIRRTSVLITSPAGYPCLTYVIDKNFLRENNVQAQMIASVLGSKAWADDEKTMTFEFKGHLVKLIRAQNVTLNLSQVLHSFDGAGSLLCDILKPFGFELTIDGLTEALKDGDEVVGEVALPTDWSPVAEVLYYNRNSYSYGYVFSSNIDSLHSFFNYLTAIPSFTLEAFGMNANGEYVGDPARLQQQPALRELVSYVQSKGASRWPAVRTPVQIKGIHKILERFDNYAPKRKMIIQGYQQTKLLNAKFNHDIVEQATGLKRGRGLQKFMDTYRDSFRSPGEFEFHVLSSTPETIEESLKAFLVKYRTPTPPVERQLENTVTDGFDIPF